MEAEILFEAFTKKESGPQMVQFILIANAFIITQSYFLFSKIFVMFITVTKWYR